MLQRTFIYIKMRHQSMCFDFGIKQKESETCDKLKR